MSGLEIQLVQGSFFVEMIIATWILLIPMKKKEHYAIKAVLCFLIGFLLAAADTNDSIKFIIETGMVVLVMHILYIISWKRTLYTVVCAYAMQHLSYAIWMSIKCFKGMLTSVPSAITNQGPDISWESTLVAIIVYGACYFIFVRKKKGKSEYDISGTLMIGFSLGVFVVVYFLSRTVQWYANNDNYELQLVCHLYAIACCIFILALDDGVYRRIQDETELSTIKYLWSERQDQYVIAKDNINAINTKCHELKRQITEIQETQVSDDLRQSLEELKDCIQIYDAVVKTGNEVLDVVLTEKSIFCQVNHITLACIVDGARLHFMETTDVYVLFTELLDSAISDIKMLKNAEKKQIAISIWEQNRFLMIQLENYYENNEEEEGVGQSIDYSRKSVEQIVKKYKGYFTVSVEHALKIRRISFPLSIET